MLVSLILILAITAGGFALTYMLERDEPILWRAAAGCVIGGALFGTSALVLAMLFGLSAGTVVAALLIAAAPAGLLVRGGVRSAFERDRARAMGKLDGANSAKMLRFAYYLAFAVLFFVFFDRAMIVTAEGIFTGGSNNLGDLPFHLGAIYSFTDGANFPPQNPNFAGAKFSYPFIADLITACFMKLGANVRDAMFVQNVAWAMSLLVVLERFVLRVSGDRLAGKIAPVLLFFSGGLGFLWFLSDFSAQGKGFFDFLNAIPKDYTIGDDFRWGNSLTTLFLTQRSLLLGMPITILVLGVLWTIFSFDAAPRDESHAKSRLDELRSVSFGVISISPALPFAGFLAGSLVLIHLHSLFVLFVVSAFIVLWHFDRVRLTEMAIFAASVALIAVPELIWSLSGSASRASEFIDWHFGFDKREDNFVWFWLKNTGLLIPLIFVGIYLGLSKQRGEVSVAAKGKNKEPHDASPGRGRKMAMFFVPFVLLFVIANVAKLAPWEWDNIKVLIYWFVGALPFVALAVAWLWRGGGARKAAALACLFVLTAAGALDVFRTISRQIDYKVFDAEAVAVAERVRAVTPPRALFLHRPTYNSAIVLTGRPSLLRYPGHLSSHGIDYLEREADARRMYAGGPEAVRLFEKYGIEYVLMSPEERLSMSPIGPFFARYPVVADVGQYKVYKVR